MNRFELKAVAGLAAIFALRMFGLCMLLPIFAVEALQYTNANVQLIGIAVGSYGLAQAILQVPFGFASDRLGRKLVIIIGLSIILLGSLIGAVATSIYGLIIGRILQGCGSIGSVVLAAMTESVREETRPRAMAVLGATIGISFVASMVLGPWLSQYIGLSGIFAVIAALAAMCMPLVAFVPKIEPIAVESAQNRLAIFKNWQLLEINFGVFVLHAVLAALFLVLPNILQQAGIVANKVWQFYTGSLVIAMLVAWRLIGRKHGKNLCRLQRIAIFCLLFAQVLLYTIDGWLYIAGSMVLFFSAFCVLEASLPALVAKHATAENRGTAMGLYSCLQFIGVFVGGVIGGWLHSYIGPTAVLSFCILLVVCWLLFNMLSQKSQHDYAGIKSSLLSEG